MVLDTIRSHVDQAVLSEQQTGFLTNMLVHRMIASGHVPPDPSLGQVATLVRQYVETLPCSSSAMTLMATPLGPAASPSSSFGPADYPSRKRPLRSVFSRALGRRNLGPRTGSSSYDAAAMTYVIVIAGQDYHFLNYATVLTPSFASGGRGFCASDSVRAALLVRCYNETGVPAAPVSVTFISYVTP